MRLAAIFTRPQLGFGPQHHLFVAGLVCSIIASIASGLSGAVNSFFFLDTSASPLTTVTMKPGSYHRRLCDEVGHLAYLRNRSVEGLHFFLFQPPAFPLRFPAFPVNGVHLRDKGTDLAPADVFTNHATVDLS